MSWYTLKAGYISFKSSDNVHANLFQGIYIPSAQIAFCPYNNAKIMHIVVDLKSICPQSNSLPGPHIGRYPSHRWLPESINTIEDFIVQ